MKTDYGQSGYYKCKPESKVNVCVSNNDWKAQVFNKENLEFAHREILKIIDDYNHSLEIPIKTCHWYQRCKKPDNKP